MDGVGKERSSFKAKVQKLGSTLSSMVMPNIGALIAWGVLTALFIPDGYLPNEEFATMVGPMLTYLIPIMIGYTGGKVIAGDRGAIVGAIATMGVIVGTDIPMMLGAMLMGPLAGFCMKKFDQLFQHRIRAGFEMLVNNFSAGLIGFALALLGFSIVGPVVDTLTKAMASGVDMILSAHLIPLANIFIEPAKILFLNNAINHGILTPLGTEQVAEAGKSILFLLEANPGPGLGVLLAFTLFGKGAAKSSAPGAVIIHFLGGIHEIYFPYVMMKPMMFLAVIAGGISGSFTFQALGAGLQAPASPGSIIAIMAMAPQGGHLSVLLGVLVGAAVSFFVAALILKGDKSTDELAFEDAVASTQEAKTQSKGLKATDIKGVSNIIFACDAGMGSSAMGASILRKKIKEANLAQEVTNSAINNLIDDSNSLIVTQIELQERAKQKAPNARFVAVENFLNSPKYDEIVRELTGNNERAVNLKKNNSPVSEDFFNGLDTSTIQEIRLVHGDKEGSATMGQKLIEEVFVKQGVNISIKKVSVNDLKEKDQTLFIFTEDLTDEVSKRIKNSLLLPVDSLVKTKPYENLAKKIKEGHKNG